MARNVHVSLIIHPFIAYSLIGVKSTSFQIFDVTGVGLTEMPCCSAILLWIAEGSVSGRSARRPAMIAAQKVMNPINQRQGTNMPRTDAGTGPNVGAPCNITVKSATSGARSRGLNMSESEPP